MSTKNFIAQLIKLTGEQSERALAQKTGILPNRLNRWKKQGREFRETLEWLGSVSRTYKLKAGALERLIEVTLLEKKDRK